LEIVSALKIWLELHTGQFLCADLLPELLKILLHFLHWSQSLSKYTLPPPIIIARASEKDNATFLRALW
jgi:hypothetical protein